MGHNQFYIDSLHRLCRNPHVDPKSVPRSSYTTTNSAPTMSPSSPKTRGAQAVPPRSMPGGKRAKALGPGGGRRAVRGEPRSLGKGDPQIRGFLEPLSGQKRCDHLLGREIPHGSFLRGILVMLLS